MQKVWKFPIIVIPFLMIMSCSQPTGENGGGTSPGGGTGEQTDSIEVSLGPYEFIWNLDTDVEYGYFVDGMPWIIVPDNGVSLVSVTPARQNNASVYDRSGNSYNADIHMTVINPPVGTSWSGDTRVDIPAFGWDSRGCIRYGLGGGYDEDLPWDGTTPAALSSGDVIVTAYSKTVPLLEAYGSNDESVLEAAAILTVLAEAPPEDAFRPGLLRSEARKANPVFYRLSDIIDVTPHLIDEPSAGLNGQAVTARLTLDADRLEACLPGPAILVSGLNNSRSSNASYNNTTLSMWSGEVESVSYGNPTAIALGDLAIGSLASWLTPEQRRVCQIRFIQRGIDAYESVLAGLSLSHAGGLLPGYAGVITVTGLLLNDDQMLLINQSVNGESPNRYFGDYSQFVEIVAPEDEDESQSKISYANTDIDVNMILEATDIASFSNNTLTLNGSYAWAVYRADRYIINARIKILSGTGAGTRIYTVTGFSDFTGSEHNVQGGTLTVVPDWDIVPDGTSRLVVSALSDQDIGTGKFKTNGITNDSTLDLDGLSASPNQPYASVNAGAYIALIIAIEALDGQEHYLSKSTDWLLRIGETPGYGEYVFTGTMSRSIPDKYHFLGGLWREVVLEPRGRTFSISGDTGDDIFTHLETVPEGSELWQ